MTRISAALLVSFLFASSVEAQSLQQLTPAYDTGAAYGLDTGDLDGDGDLDLVAAYRGASAGADNEWYLNDGTGVLTPGGTFPGFTDNTMAVAIADFDQDGRLDVIFANAYANNDSCGNPDPCDENVVYLNIGNQTPPSAIVDFVGTATWTDGLNDGSWDVEAADLNGDGWPDFVVANLSGTESRIWLNDNLPSGTVSFTSQAVPGAPVTAAGVTVADFNGDGFNDIAFSSGAILLSTTLAGGFDGFVRSDLGVSAARVEAGDLDGDSDIDLILVGNYSANTVYLNDGLGAFSAGISFGSTGNPRFESDLADINDDGHLDLVAAGYQFRATPFDFFQMGNGDGTFSLGSVSGYSGQFAVELADLNGDTHADVMTSNPSQVWINTSATAPLIVTNTNDSGPGSLRAAIEFANGSATPSEQITFDIPGPGPHVIGVLSELTITDTVNLNGVSQPGAVCGPDVGGHDLRIVLDGSSAPDRGLVVTPNGSGTVIQGLVINGFPGLAVTLDGAANTVVRCNYLGTDVSGTSVVQLGSTAIQISAGSGNEIGGASPSDGNLISGFAGTLGVVVSGSVGTVIQNNVIGLTADADAVLRPTTEGRVGISTYASASTEIVDNVIGGFPLFGIEFQFEEFSEIRGNFVGTNAAGDTGLGNYIGILLQRQTIGTFIESNTIANNTDDGISIISGRDQDVSVDAESTDNTISQNIIRDNGGSGIDLGATVICDAGATTNCTGGLWPNADGPSPNDPGDADTGSNTLINHPEIVRAEITPSDELIVLYRVDTDGAGPLAVEFFLGDTNGEEGALYLGNDIYNVQPGVTKNAVFPSASTLGIGTGDDLVATLTSAGGNTSEFSSPGIEVVESGTYVVTQTDDTGTGSLRDALTLANLSPNGASPDLITFAIPGPGPHVIAPASGLPIITDPVTIDGTTQAGSVCGTSDISDRVLSIVLDGSGLAYNPGGPNADGLTVAENTNNVSVHGLVISGFPGAGIFVRSGNSGGVIQCNNIGTDVTGMLPAGNFGAGIQIVGFSSESNNILVGGPTPADGNLIAANGYDEIHLEPGADLNEFRNNLIGTDATGAAVLRAPPSHFGDPGVDTFSNLIGIGLNQAGNNLFAENVIGGFGAGMEIVSSGDGETFAGGFNEVSSNFIGTDRSGTASLGNGTGISIFGSGLGGETIGGDSPPDGNLIRYNGTGINVAGAPDHVISFNTIDQNGADGVVVAGSGAPPYPSVSILSNSISDNGGLGIDLGGDGFTANDEGDGDAGPNELVNFPTLSSATLAAGGASLDVSLFIDTSFPVTVEVFSTDADREEGAVFLGSETFASPPLTRTITIPVPSVSAGDFIVATTTNADGNTSEFSLPAEVSSGQDIIMLPNQRVIPTDVLTFLIDPDIAAIPGMSVAISSAISTIQNVPTSTAGTRMAFGGISGVPLGPVVNDGVNAVTRSGAEFPLSSNTLAVASKLLYTGIPGQEARIVEADVVFNADLLGSSTGLGTDEQPGIWDVRAVALHEFIHSVGGRHLGTSTATMFFSIPSGTSYRTLEADDIAQLTAMYPSPLAAGTFGQISGRVVNGETGSLDPIGGGLVVAQDVISGDRVSAYTDENGDYTVHGLEPGDYRVSIQPLDGFVDNIPGMTAATVSQYLDSIADNATFFKEVYSGVDEGANEEPDTFQPVSVAVGATTSGIDFITNVDSTPPTVNGATPSSDRAPIRPEIAVTFSETIVAANLSLQLIDDTGSPVAGIVGVADGQGPIATFTLPAGASLLNARTYEIRVTGQTDVKGNTNANVFTSTFTTRPVDTVPPTVVSVVPAGGSAGIAPDANVTITFSEPMDQASVEAGLGLSCASGPAGSACPAAVAGTFSFPSVIGVEPDYVVVFTPGDVLAEDATYQITFAPSIADAAGGNSIGTVSSFSFQTQPNAAPVATDFGPADGATGVSIRTSIYVDFSERMVLPAADPVELTGPAGQIAGTAELLNDGRRVVFRPDLPLPYSTVFSVSISGAFTDASTPPEGLVSPPAFSFTTAATPPAVSIEAISPVVAIPGAVVALSGNGFSAVPAENMVSFTGAAGTIDVVPQTSTLNSLTVVVPDGAVAGPVTVTVSGSSDSIDLELYDVLPLLDPAVTRATAESAPRDVEVSPDGGTAFVTNTGSNSISVLDVATGALIRSIIVGESPMKVVLSPDGTRIYVSNFGSHSVSEIDLRTLSVVRTISVGLNPYGMAISPDGKRLYVAEYTSRKISIIDVDQESGTANQAIARITVESTERDVNEYPDGGVTTVGVESNPRDVEVSPDGGSLFFTTQGLGLRVLLLDANGSASEDAGTIRITSERNTRDVEVSPDGGVVWVTTLAGALEGYRIPASLTSASSFSAVARLGEETNSREVEVSPDGGTLYVTSFDLGLVTIYSISSQATPSTESATFGLILTPIESIVVGDEPEAVVFSASSNLAIVVNSGSDDISVLRYTPGDTDADGLGDGEELAGGTDPNNPDTDGDTFLDGADAFPLDPAEWVDQDGDGTGDNADLDDDGNLVHDARQLLIASIETLINDRDPSILNGSAGKTALTAPEGWTWESDDVQQTEESRFDFLLLRLLYARDGLIQNADPENWIDSLHVKQSFGLELFVHSRRAVETFDSFKRKDNPSLDTDSLSRAVVDLEAQLTDTAIGEIECGTSWGCRLARRFAEYSRDSAQREIDREDWDDAIEDLFKAWSYAQLATAAAGKDGDTNAALVTDEALPTEFDLAPNYPNPFNPTTTLDYALPEAANVSIIVYDMLGREVATILDDELEAGFHSVRFDASTLPSGMYVYRMVAGDFVKVRTMTLVK